MMKHVGRMGDKKVAVVFREVPDEEHMALVVYPDQLQQNLHDDLMNAIQSTKGQEAKHLGEALHGMTGTNGETILNTIHRERFMKKVRTQDIIMIPQPNNPGVRLDELNEIIRGMETGSDAAAKMAKVDAEAGLADPQKTTAGNAAAAQVGGAGALTDEAIAANLVTQAEQMRTQMKGLETEVNRLMEEAQSLNPALKPKKAKRGRPAKATA